MGLPLAPGTAGLSDSSIFSLVLSYFFVSKNIDTLSIMTIPVSTFTHSENSLLFFIFH